MTQNIEVTLSDKAYNQILKWAQSRHLEVSDAVATLLDETLLPKIPVYVPPAEEDPAVEREKAAFLDMFPKLKREYAGRFVAILHGEVIDHDEDYGTLFERIDQRYPDTFVWLSRVEDNPIETIVFRSPRFVEGEQ